MNTVSGESPARRSRMAAGPALAGFGPAMLRPFARVTSGGRFVPCVDGLRCIAILAVVLYHLNGYIVEKAGGFSEADARQTHLFHLLHGANCGVQLFFAISGFILALPFAREQLDGGRRVALKQYYLRRVTRLEPPFVINLLIIWILLIVVKKKSVAELTAPLAATATYTHNWIYGTLSTVNVVTWSLEIEVQFYILAPFLARWYFTRPQRRRRGVIVMAIALMLAVKMMWVPENKLRLGLLYPLNHFLTGILLADLFVNVWKEQPQQSSNWDFIAIVSLPLIFLIQQNPLTYHLLPLLSGLLLAAAFLGPLTNRLLSVPLVVVTGGMCYSIYLYHLLVISMLGRFTMGWTDGYGYSTQMLLQSLLVVPPVVIVCAVFFVAIEKPFMKWRPKVADA
ncbi:MAG: acyltransferase [Planctomycetaceae bacterium]|nr:acyltransferase [Planctomycetaceae bacterium]